MLLSVPDLSANQVLVSRGADSSRLRIDPTPQFILLESWSVQFSPRREGSGSDTDLGLSTVYKHGIGLFRSIYTFLRVLPAWKLHKRLRRRGAVPSNRNANLNIELRVRSGQNQGGVLGFGKHPLLCLLRHAHPHISLVAQTCLRQRKPLPLSPSHTRFRRSLILMETSLYLSVTSPIHTSNWMN